MRELTLLEHILRSHRSLPDAVTIGPGDDLATLRFGDDQLLVGVDQVADGLHFDAACTPLAKMARKAITRNLSDVAAMASEPVAALVAACLPASFGQRRATELFEQMRLIGSRFGCPLIGGDIAIWDQPLVLTVTILARAGSIVPVRRCGAQVGDLICVTGQLGGSGLTVEGYTHPLDFEPRVALARTLAGARHTRPHCMIDLSDGLGVDLPHLCRASNVAAEVWVDRLPISDRARSAGPAGEPWRCALDDGEDYELCFTVSPGQAQSGLPDQIDGVPISRIGVIRPADSDHLLTLKLPDGSLKAAGHMGFEHGRPPVPRG